MSARGFRLAPAFILLCGLGAIGANALAAPRERQGTVHSGPRIVLDGQASTGKPTAPIAVSYELGGTPGLGQPLAVRIAAQPADGVTDLTLELNGDAALHVGAVTRASGAGDAEHVWTVTVTPLQEGLGHLNVSVTGRLNGTEQTRSLLIPIRTSGAANGDGARKAVASAADERVISLPAEETR